MIFDTHTHYDDEAFEEDRDALISSLSAKNVGLVVNVGASLSSCRETLRMAEKYSFVYGAIGVHPSETAELNEDNFSQLSEMVKHEKCVAVGEIGLDYYWPEPDRETQKFWFKRQIGLARELNLPVVIHSRDAANDTITIMKDMHAEEIGGVIHCFSYTRETAEIFLKMGFYIGIGGVVTFKNARKIKEAVEEIPLERIVLETDCPYLAPVPFRGKRNSSLNIPYVIEEIARIKQVSPNEIEEITWENAHRLYRI